MLYRPFYRYIPIYQNMYLHWKRSWIWTQCQTNLRYDIVLLVVQALSAGVWQGENPDSKVHGANMGPTWGRQDPGRPHVGHANLAIWEALPLPPLGIRITMSLSPWLLDGLTHILRPCSGCGCYMQGCMSPRKLGHGWSIAYLGLCGKYYRYTPYTRCWFRKR